MSKLDDLLAQYWDAAYKEGEQCRIYDTEDGLAQSLLMQIKDEFNSAYRKGQEDMQERAARTCADAWKETLLGGCRASWNSAVNSCVADIRALEIKGE